MLGKREILEPGANREGYWKSGDMIRQLQGAIDSFKIMHPQCTAVFIFDQSSNHCAYSDDALRAHNMNMNPGGKEKQKRMKDGVFKKDGVEIVQSMYYPSDYEDEDLHGQAKVCVYTLVISEMEALSL